MGARPLCGRLTRSGDPCRAVVRYSAALEQFAPACRKHMTDAEREEVDSDPLWSDEGQILWFLQRRGDADDLVHASQIAEALKTPTQLVSWRLRELRERGQVAAREEGRRELWGTVDQVGRLEEAERAKRWRAERERATAERGIVEGNEALREIRRHLRQAVEGQPIDVAALSGAFPATTEEVHPDLLMISTRDPSAAAWLLGRLSHPAPEEGKPTDEEWSTHWDRLDELLAPLQWAGWVADEDDAFGEYDREAGPVLCYRLQRTCMALEVEYQPARALRLAPFVDVGGEMLETFSMLDSEVTIDLSGSASHQERAVAIQCGELGLLDATRVEIADSEMSAAEFMAEQHTRWVFGAAAQDRGVTIKQVVAELAEDEYLSTFLDLHWRLFAPNVLPDLVPDAAALGIAAWCWRNDTAVEAWHLPSDVLMARVNIAVTEAVHPHIDPFEGIFWDGIKQTIIDPAWSLPDGRAISELFGEGWPQVRDTVLARLDDWRHRDERLLGTHATLRLLTIAGSTSYTSSWWGQGRWRAICAAVIGDAAQAGIKLPDPYDELGPESLLADLERPSQLNDEVLEWLIDMPAAGVDGPRGLRMHEATHPLVRVIELHPE